jgi:hypothetical protein
MILRTFLRIIHAKKESSSQQKIKLREEVSCKYTKINLKYLGMFAIISG